MSKTEFQEFQGTQSNNLKKLTDISNDLSFIKETVRKKNPNLPESEVTQRAVAWQEITKGVLQINNEMSRQ